LAIRIGVPREQRPTEIENKHRARHSPHPKP
jgi:hypothetical protein